MQKRLNGFSAVESNTQIAIEFMCKKARQNVRPGVCAGNKRTRVANGAVARFAVCLLAHIYFLLLWWGTFVPSVVLKPKPKSHDDDVTTTTTMLEGKRRPKERVHHIVVQSVRRFNCFCFALRHGLVSLLHGKSIPLSASFLFFFCFQLCSFFHSLTLAPIGALSIHSHGRWWYPFFAFIALFSLLFVRFAWSKFVTIYFAYLCVV